MNIRLLPSQNTPASEEFSWSRQWAKVPDLWRAGSYRLDQEPFNRVFSRNQNYLRSEKAYSFVPETYQRIRNECSWWVWTLYDEGTRKIEPSMLMWWGRAITSLAETRAAFGTPVDECSVADLDPNVAIHEAITMFYARNNRYPSPGTQRNLESTAHSIYEHITVRCTDTQWWRHDIWDMRLDQRIPRRPEEPHADRVINIGAIEPAWLREGIRFWLSRMLTLDALTWTSAASRVTSVGRQAGAFFLQQAITDPRLAPDAKGIREITMRLLAYLRSPEASKSGKPLAATTVNAVQSAVQNLYLFMVENAEDAAKATDDPRWGQLTSDHTRLWPPAFGSKRSGNKAEIRYHTDADLAALLAHLPVLAAPTTETVTIDHAGTTTYRGLGDPQAARIWRIQALTGRRASEILMLPYDPITPINFPGTPDSGPAAPDALVARMRYAQTKVDDVEPSILVPQGVVNIIKEQQAWHQEHFPSSPREYLFLQPRGNYRAQIPRSYRSYHDALKRATDALKLTNSNGQRLHYTETHRLRHTLATNMLNANVPVHVLQRYLGHKSPEMTMRYAQTLDETARKEFLKHQQIGAHGREVTIAPQDLIDLKQMEKRADRILPNGICLLPPTKTCDKGNACLPCGSFATDVTHLPDHQQQREAITSQIKYRQAQFQERTGKPMTEDHIWLKERLRELASLDAIIDRLEQDDASEDQYVRAPGASGKTVPLKLVTNPQQKQILQDQLNQKISRPTAQDGNL